MTTTTRHGHKTLQLSQIAPGKSAAFSPNLYRWMRAHAHFAKAGGVLETVFRVKPGTTLANSFGPNTLLIGFLNDDCFTGNRVIRTMCVGAKADSLSFAAAGAVLEEVDGFWDRYLEIGRCAIDPDHVEAFVGDRFSEENNIRSCLWCGAEHKLVKTSRTVVVVDESWEPL